MARQIQKSATSVIVYDDQLVSQISPDVFEPAHWQAAESVSGYARGRGATLCIELSGYDCVLRHYYRGGLAGRVLNDQFLWTGAARVRSILEWDLLRQIAAAGLPAPAAVAARYVQHGGWYTADLITLKIPDVMPFSQWLEQDRPTREIWRRVGQCIAGFHAAGFCHADLNAHNLQITADGQVFLLDWDRGMLRSPGRWRNGNLARLHRSCKKISRAGHIKFLAADWEALLAGYYQS